MLCSPDNERAVKDGFDRRRLSIPDRQNPHIGLTRLEQ